MSERLRIVLTGCEGFIGRRLFAAFSESGHTVLGIDPRSKRTEHGNSATRPLLRAEEVNEWRPDAIVLCGAVKSLVECQMTVSSVRSNVFDLETCLQYVWNRRNVQVVYVSSDMVFGGLPRRGLFAETHPVLAANAYGRMKIAGEQIVSLLPSTSIVRTSLVYGELTDDEQRCYSDVICGGELVNQSLFFYWAWEQIRLHGKVKVACNVFSSPTWVEDLVRDIVQIVEKRLLGTFHSCGPERLSRLEMLQRVLSPLGMQDYLECRTVPEGGIRPLDVSLDSTMTRQRLQTVCHRVDEVMTPIMRRSFPL